MNKYIFAATIAAVALANPTTARAQAKERVAFVSAVDKSGAPVAGLTADALTIKDNGKAGQIVTVAPATEPIDIAFLFDNSSSTTDTIRFQREAVAKFVTTLAPTSRIALIAIAERPLTIVNYTNDPKALTDGVNKLFTMAGTKMSLLQAVIESSGALARRGGPRRVIVALLTDGAEGSNNLYENVKEAMKAADVQLHTVTLGKFASGSAVGATPARGSQEATSNGLTTVFERQMLIEDGPTDTGGHRVPVLTPPGLDQEVQKLAQELMSQYKVVYTSTEASKGDKDKIEIKSTKKDVNIRGTRTRSQAAAPAK